MQKFDSIQKSVMSIFGAASWTSNSIKTFPENFVGSVPENEYIRINILPHGEGINLNSVSGVLMIDVFVPSGEGILRRGQIADLLDVQLVGKVITSSGGIIQFGKSSMSSEGVDKDNPSLFRSIYTVPFNFFGV